MTDIAESFVQFHNGAGGFTSDLVLTINEDLSGNVWFGSIDKGAFVLRREERSVDTYELKFLPRHRFTRQQHLRNSD